MQHPISVLYFIVAKLLGNQQSPHAPFLSFDLFHLTYATTSVTKKIAKCL